MLRTMHLLAIAAAVISASACEFSVSTANLSEETMASAINTETKMPVTPTTTFTPDAPAIYATANLSNAPEGTKVKASFHYVEDGDVLISEDEITADSGARVAFTLSAPDNGWPVGKYETRLFLNGEEVKRLPFTVAAAE